jgi:S-adenosylmethionine hydrolase
MHGVVLSIVPDARVVNISHEVAKYSIRDGALLLWCALPYLPVGVHVAVVDPGVGTARRPIALRTQRGDVLVGPDNGLLLPGAERLGGIDSAHIVENEAYRLPVVSTSFHGRDIFAPAAAHVAAGVPVDRLGAPVDAADLVGSPIPEPTIGAEALISEIVYVDTFGNVKLAGMRHDLEAALGRLVPDNALIVSIGGDATPVTIELRWRATFGDAKVGEQLLYEDSYGRICLAENLGNAAASLGLHEGQTLSIRRA